MTDRANRITAEYLLRQVPEEPLPRVDEYVSPIRFIAGWVVVVAIAALIWIGV